MPALTRRRYPESPRGWHVYYRDVRVGTIAKRVGVPFGEDPSSGFYPGSHPKAMEPPRQEPLQQRPARYRDVRKLVHSA
jgi:hypothetical protein